MRKRHRHRRAARPTRSHPVSGVGGAKLREGGKGPDNLAGALGIRGPFPAPFVHFHLSRRCHWNVAFPLSFEHSAKST